MDGQYQVKCVKSSLRKKEKNNEHQPIAVSLTIAPHNITFSMFKP